MALNRKFLILCGVAGLVFASSLWAMNSHAKYLTAKAPAAVLKASATRTATRTPTVTYTATETLTPTITETPTEGDTPTPSDTPTETQTPVPVYTPYPSAPACTEHDNSTFHTLWNSALGCHYDHEHGTSPFTQVVSDTFPGFDLFALLGNVGVSHTNPSGPMENTMKHGGHKWDVTLTHSAGCAGREGVPTGVDALVIQYHAFGNYAVEFEARIHSAGGMLRQCQVGNPTDYGYVYVIQHQDYGQRTVPYQGVILQYPDTPLPAYDSAREPYLAMSCFGGPPPCDKYPTLASVINRDANSDTTWISEPNNLISFGSPLFGILFRARDTYQMLDWNDQTYPFTFAWICTLDNGLTYNPIGCRHNNTTTRVHEVMGEIPVAWDNLEGFDTNPTVGRITANGFVTHFGDLNLLCVAPGPDCHPIKLVSAFTGRYGTLFDISGDDVPLHPANLPERDIYFCGGLPCNEFDPGATPSGWVGSEN
jgi:hypothetical protein